MDVADTLPIIGTMHLHYCETDYRERTSRVTRRVYPDVTGVGLHDTVLSRRRGPDCGCVRQVSVSYGNELLYLTCRSSRLFKGRPSAYTDLNCFVTWMFVVTQRDE